MKALLDKLITRENAVRFLIILGCAVFTLAWSYVAISLISQDWGWLSGGDSVKDADFVVELLFIIGYVPLLAGIIGTLIYLNGRFWMVRCLKNSLTSLVSIFGFVPVVSELYRPEDPLDEIVYCYDGSSYIIYDGLPMIIALPLGIAITLVKGVVKFALWLIAAIGIPVLGPALLLLGLAGASYLLELQAVLTVIGGLLAAAATMFLLIAVPIMGLKKA